VVTVGVCESEAAALREGAPVSEGVAEPHGEAEGVVAPVGVPVPPVADTEGQLLPVTLRCVELEAVGDAETEAHGESVRTGEEDTVGVPVAALVLLTETHTVPVGDTEGDSEKEGELVAPPEAVPAAPWRVGDTEALPVTNTV